MKRSFATLTLVFFLLLYNVLPGHILNMLLKHPIPSHPAIQGHWKRCRSRLWSPWKGFGMSRMKQLSNTFDYSLSCTPVNPWWSNIHFRNHPWYSWISHGIHLHPSNPQRATRPSLKFPPTEMLEPPQPLRFQHSGTNWLLTYSKLPQWKPFKTPGRPTGSPSSPKLPYSPCPPTAHFFGTHWPA